MVKEIHIKMNGAADPDPCELSKRGGDTVVWFAEDKQHDVHVIFAETSPFTNKNRVIKHGGGGSEHTDEIHPSTNKGPFDYSVKSEVTEMVADPQIIILD